MRPGSTTGSKVAPSTEQSDLKEVDTQARWPDVNKLISTEALPSLFPHPGSASTRVNGWEKSPLAGLNRRSTKWRSNCAEASQGKSAGHRARSAVSQPHRRKVHQQSDAQGQEDRGADDPL